jgi:hypothetical protein
MYKFLRFKRKKNNTVSIILRQRYRKFGKEKDTYIRKQSLIIEGIEGAGKTRYLNKIYSLRNQIYKRLAKKHHFLYISNTEGISDIFDKIHDKLIEFFDYEEDDLKRLKVSKKIELIEEYTNNNIVFVDNIDRFTGRKLELLKVLIRDCKLIVATIKNMNTLNRTIKEGLKKHEIQILNLKSNASTDATNVLFIMFLLTLLITGNFELAALIMAGKLVLKGIEK